MPVDPRSAGFTLIELLVALALFALISLAGIRLVETLIGVQTRTAGRADRLAEIQRGLYLAGADFEQLTGGPDRSGDRITLTRASRDGEYQVSYMLEEQGLHRIVNGNDRLLIGHVRAVRWRFLKDGAWTEQPITPDRRDRAAGVELIIDLAPGSGGVGGEARRVFELPASP
ncbi:MAG: prepilin-type N-terminal cleavage/methylation domain-containing protein [Novosphingobium sp.]